MRNFKLNLMEDFDYDGPIDDQFFEENYDKDRMFANIYGDNALCSLNRDLDIMNKKYKRLDKDSNVAKKFARQIRAKVAIIEDLI